MKIRNNSRKITLLLSILFLAGNHLAAEKSRQEASFKCSPVIFEFHQDSVRYSFTTYLDTKEIRNYENWIVAPHILLGNGADSTRISLSPVSLEGSLYTKLQDRKPILSRGAIPAEHFPEFIPVGKKDTVYAFPYEGAISIKEGEEIRGVNTSILIRDNCYKNKKPANVVADFLYKDENINQPFRLPTLRGDGITSENLKIRKVEGHAFIHFNINKADIQLDKGDNRAQIEQMTQAFRKILTDPYARFDSAHIKGQSSPEGPFEWNNKLALRRSRSALNFLMAELKELRIPYEESQLKVSAIPEAWDELCEKIEASDLDEKEKKTVLNIIRNTPIKAEREYLLRQRRNTFKYLREEILGNIRRVDYAFFLTFKDLTLEEQIGLLHKRPDIYSPSDFLAVANYVTDTDLKLETLGIARRFYPENSDILATLLDSYLSMDDLDKAGELIDGLDNISSHMRNHKFMRNASVYYFLTGREESLKGLLHDLRFNEGALDAEAQKELRYQSGLLALSDRDYPAAAESLAGFNDLNTVLAFLGAERYEEAWQIAQGLSCSSAREYYVKAMAAAYAGADEQATGLVKQALELDGGLREQVEREYIFQDLEIARL